MKNYEHNQLEPGVLTRSLLILFLLIHLPVGVIHASYTTLGNKFRNFTTQDGLADNMIFVFIRIRRALCGLELIMD